MQWILESLALPGHEIGEWLRGIYSQVVEIDGMEYTVEGIDEFHVVPVGAGKIVIAKVHLEPNFRDDLLSEKNITELELGVNGRD